MPILLILFLFSTPVFAGDNSLAKSDTTLKNLDLIKKVTDQAEKLLPSLAHDERDYGFYAAITNKPLVPVITKVIHQPDGSTTKLVVEVYVEFARMIGGHETGSEYGSGSCDITLSRNQENQWVTGGHCANAEWEKDYNK
jgi:hypothetical protein